MSFYKYYKNRKDWRKPHRCPKSYDASCRNHGACSYCTDNRKYFDKKYRQIADEKLKEYYEDYLDETFKNWIFGQC